MHPRNPLLELPVATAVRSVARRYLREVVSSAEKVRSHRDAASIHDFRVALRRLRSWVRAFRPVLDGSLRPRHRRRLRRLHAASGRGRNADVGIEWIERLLDGGEPGDAVTALLAELREKRSDAAERLARRLERRVPRLARRLDGRLSRYEVDVDADAPELPRTMAHALGATLAEAAGELRARFEAVGTEVAAEPAHRARIAAKRVRYLIAPLAAEIRGGKGLVRELKRVQTLLGDIHDLDVFPLELAAAGHADDPLPPALALLSGRARTQREAIAREVAAAWEEGITPGLLDRLDALAAELGGPGEDVEIERKFLLSSLPVIPDGAEELEVEQGWFGEKIAERVRRVRSAEGERAYRAIKHGRGVKRLELEEPITPALFDVLWPLTEGRRVRKRRYRVREGDLCWEIDRFTDRALVLAEVELPAADHPIVLPVWLAAHVVREVTGESAYVNLNLAG